MEEIKRLIDQRYREYFGKDNDYKLAKQWFYDFAEFLSRSGLTEKQIRETTLFMMRDSFLDNMQEIKKTGYQFSEGRMFLNEENAFFKYLSTISHKMSPEYVLEGIRFAKYDSQDKGNFIDSFIKYIAITNFQDLHVDSEIPNMNDGEIGKILCKLGEFEVARVTVEELEESVKFDNLETRYNLEGTKIGSVLFRKLQEDVATYFPGKDLLASNVLESDERAKGFYRAMGGILQRSWEPNRALVFFPAERLQVLSKKPIEQPILVFQNTLQTPEETSQADLTHESSQEKTIEESMSEIKRLIDKRYREYFKKDASSNLAKKWFYDFAEFLVRNQLSQEQIIRTISVMMNDNNLKNMVSKSGENFIDDERSLKQEEEEFFKYLESISGRITPDYLAKGLRFAEIENQENYNFMDSFIRYIIITNFQDLHIESQIPELNEKKWGDVVAKLGGFRITSVTAEKSPDKILFIAFGTRKNLRSIRIGNLVFRRLQADVTKYFPGMDLVATTVNETNSGGIKFYESMGGTVVKHENGIDVTVLFTAEELKELSRIPVEPPQIFKKSRKLSELHKYTNLPTEESPAMEIRKYIEKLVQKQEQYLNLGYSVPEEFKFPEKIELSPQNWEYLLEQDSWGGVNYDKTNDEMRFLWTTPDKFPELELRAKKADNGKYVLTYIKSKSVDGKKDFVWDSKKRDGKNGILVVSRENDPLDKLINMDVDIDK